VRCRNRGFSSHATAILKCDWTFSFIIRYIYICICVCVCVCVYVCIRMFINQPGIIWTHFVSSLILWACNKLRQKRSFRHVYSTIYEIFTDVFSFCNLRTFPDCGRCAQRILFSCPHSTFIVRVWVCACVRWSLSVINVDNSARKVTWLRNGVSSCYRLITTTLRRWPSPLYYGWDSSRRYKGRSMRLTTYKYLLLKLRTHGTVLGPGSSVGIANDYGLDGPGSNPGRGEIFRTRPGRTWGPPSLIYNGYRVFSVGEADGAWCWPPIPF
jgi:hypothetical protein